MKKFNRYELLNFLQESLMRKENAFLDAFLEEFDINRIPLDVRQRQYKDYLPIFNFVNRECREWTLDENEEYKWGEDGDVQKMNIETSLQVIEKLKSFYHLDDFQFEAYSPHHVQIIEVKKIPVYYQASGIITIPEIKKNVDIIIEEMRNSGYYKVREKRQKDNDGMQWITLVFDPVRQDSISEQIRRHCRYLYHASPQSTHDEIMSKGLIAQNQGRVYLYNEPRVYLFAGDPESSEYQKMMRNVSRNRKRLMGVEEEYILYDLRTSKIPKTAEFFEDPHGGAGCIYTTQDIPSKAIADFNDLEIEF